ncbi:MAG: VOC family protein [Acidimicrobiales bacterium]|nr:VOC family protein [Acidimicrobiales bacterium]
MNAVNLSPFLLFEGNCAEAMHFYHSCLGGQLEITRLRDTPMRDQAPPSLHDKVAYARLSSGPIEISATDWQHQTRVPRQGNTVGLYVDGATFTDLKEVFDKLAVGANPDLLDELRDLPFGSYGHLADRYGVHWFFRGERSTPSS